MPEPSETVERVVKRLRVGPATASVMGDADRVLRRAEPTARAACRAGARQASAEAQEDLVQETLETVWRRISTFNQESSFETWVRGIARNVCANARRRRTELLSADGALDPVDPELDALRALQRHEREQLVTDAIEAALEGMEQDVLFHRHVHGLERERVAEMLGLGDADEVRVVLQRAHRRLKAELLRRLGDHGHGMSFVRTAEQ